MAAKSKILIVTLGSLHQAEGGGPEYRKQDSVLTQLSVKSSQLLLRTRTQAFKWLKEDKTATWKGVRISELEHNKGLVLGPDFGGDNHNGRYYPALRRFEGRFFQTLDLNKGKLAAYQSQHHILLLCGLYGLSALLEPVQRYNCPVETSLRNLNLWTEDNTLTDIFLDYVREHDIERVFDFTATEPRRRLISWPAVHIELKGNVLHGFSMTDAGNDALFSFGQIMAKFLLGASSERLMAIRPETEEAGILFRAIDKPRSGMPREIENQEPDLAAEIERRRRGVIRILDKVETMHGDRNETTGNRVNRLTWTGLISTHEAEAMFLILRWRNDVVYRQQLPSTDELYDIDAAWTYLTRQVEKHQWRMDEFRRK